MLTDRVFMIAGKVSLVLSIWAFLFSLTYGELPSNPKSNSCWDFFAMDNGVGRDTGWKPARQAKLLARLGYQGISYSGVKDLGNRLQIMKKHGMKVYGLYLPCDPKKQEPIAKEIWDSLPELQGTDTVLWMQVTGKTTNEKTAAALSSFADAAAQYKLRIAIYPHYGNNVATAERAYEIVRLIDRPNVGLSLNLCHELRAGNGTRLLEIVEKVADNLMMVTIHGAYKVDKINPKNPWAKLIRPLDEGDFELVNLLKKLKDVGYTGPIGQQCWSIKLEPEVNLERSVLVWRELCKKLN